MGTIQARPDTFFRIGPAEPGKPQCFAVYLSALDRISLSAPLHAPALQTYLGRLRNHPATTKQLGDYVDINPAVDLSALESDSAVGFIPMEAVSDGSTGEYTVTERPLDQVSKGYTRFANGDILWAKITPCMQNGKSCLVDGLPNGVGFGSTEFHVLRVRDPMVSKEFVREFVGQTALRRVATYAFTGSAGQQRVPAAFLSDLPFPELSETLQNELVSTMATARAERRAKLAEADALLAGLDDFLLDTVGIAPPVDDGSKVFAVRVGQSHWQGPLNADYYHPERVQALRELDRAADSMTVAPLSEVVSFVREQIKTPGANYLSLAHIQSHTGELTDASDTASGNCFTFQAGDVLFARLRPYLNKVYRAEMDGCCSTEFHVLRVKDAGTLLPEYLAAVLRSRLVLAQTTHMTTGNTHPRLTNDDVAHLTVPMPSPGVQQRVADEVLRRREQTRRLRSETDASWEAAKERFEVQVLGAGGL